MHNEKAERLATASLAKLVSSLVNSKTWAHKLLNYIEHKLYEETVVKNVANLPHRVQMEKYLTVKAILNSIAKVVSDRRTSRNVRKGLIETLLLRSIYFNVKTRSKHLDNTELVWPAFLTISPTKRCNLHCKGCYADSTERDRDTLDADVLHWVIDQKTASWDSHFTVISGGEPLIYRSQGQDILDIYEAHKNNFFLMYTNGITINPRIAQRMADLGNVTPAISVEGLEEKTDSRRGKGVFKKIIKAMETCREYGIPFGISVTATKHNYMEILSEEFLELFFDKLGSVYMWVFHYMPIGRHFSQELMVTPKQRAHMYYRQQQILNQAKYFFADFWNSGTLSDGCISGGRFGGFLHVLWNGMVTPCVFIPYSMTNVYDLYREGRPLDDALQTELFCKIRQWQRKYSFMSPKETMGNQIMPCIIRDHYQDFRGILDECGRENIHCQDKHAAMALKDKKYFEGLVNFDKELSELSEPVWDKNYRQ